MLDLFFEIKYFLVLVRIYIFGYDEVIFLEKKICGRIFL